MRRVRWLALVSLLVAHSLVAQVQVTDKGVLLDFQDADLRLVITALAEAGDLNVVYGDLPAKKVTLRMRQPFPRDGLLPLLKSVAQSNGLRLTETPEFIRLEPASAPSPSVAGKEPGKTTARPPVQLIVYRLKHAKAAQLASTLQSIFGGRSTASGPPGARAVSLSDGLRQDAAAESQPQGAGQEVSVELGATRPAAIPGKLAGEVQIVPDDRTNALIVRAEPDDWDILKRTIEQLDLRPLQVLIEVVIAEVRSTNESGMSIFGSVKDNSGNPRVEGTLEDAKANRSLLLRLLSGGAVDIDLALSALATRGNVRILSRPVVVAQNNQEAKILIGSERPFVQSSRSLPTDGGVRDQVIQYRDVGTKLTLVPTINDDGYVNLQVLQEVSTATAELQFGAPVISTREASTHLFIKDGQTSVIGGLIDRQQEKNKSGIPGLMEIPVLGGFFGTTRNVTSNSELFLFITPHLMQSDADVERVRQDIQGQTQLLEGLLPGGTSP
jgi:general secretion pathway protein D